MEDRIMAGTGLRISRFSLGTMMYGGQTGEAESLEQIRYAIDHGITSIDTADIYNNGITEEIVGKAIAGRRAGLILASKLAGRMGPGPNDAGLSRLHVLKACEDSLRRLGTDYLDIYYLHWPDYSTPLEETLEATTQLVRSGKVRYVALSNFASWQVVQTQWIAERSHFIAPVCNQVVYNLLQRDIERELIPCLKAQKVGLTIYNPLGGGMLTGKHKRGTPEGINRFNTPQASGARTLGDIYYERYWTEANFNAVDGYAKVAAEAGIPLIELALRWCISQPAVDSILLGASRTAQLQENLALLDKPALSPETLAACDKVYDELHGIRFKYNR